MNQRVSPRGGEMPVVGGLTTSIALNEALRLPDGARFYRCALQVNPFAYLGRHNKQTTFTNEADYNTAVVQKCRDLGIEIIAVTDHYRAKHSTGLVQAARAAGVFAFGGFEASTKDGVHFLCLFDPDKDSSLERFIGECGIHRDDELSPTGSKDCLELLDCARNWGGICIAAHVAGNGGLLVTLKGQPRVNVWQANDLLACALAGPISAAPDNLRDILDNSNAQHRRDRPLAVINAQDANSPDDLEKAGSTCLIKMSKISVEALRQAFLDAESRIRLNSDPRPVPHSEFLGMAWEGGFLDGTRVHFNNNLNVLVGGRGTGKSTIIESLRYVLALEPLGEDARKAHESVIKQVLKPGTKISLLVRSHHPSERCYTIERTIPNPSVVKDETGKVMILAPRDVVRGVEVFGQHEISELTKSPEKLTLLLDRFVERDSNTASRKSRLRADLERSRAGIENVQREIKLVDERLAALPSLEETLKRFQEAGLEERLKEKSQLVREERVLTTAGERLDPVRSVHQELVGVVPIDTAFSSAKAVEGLPNAELLQQAEGILNRLTERLRLAAEQISGEIISTEQELLALRTTWNQRKASVEAHYESLLRELQKSKIDGEEFIRLKRQIEELRPLRESRETLTRDFAAYQEQRRKLLDEWENIKSAEYRALETAARKVSRSLKNRVRVDVLMAGAREPLEKLLREAIGGNLSATFERLRRSDLSLPDLAARCREGRESLVKQYGLSAVSADRLIQGGDDLFMKIEELELPSTTKIELNTAPEKETPSWQGLDSLSTGQKATAVLLLLLLESEAPLIVDQPEDDLDNRFITEGVVPTMRREKQLRQFIFSTHNANIPVLGDAELIVGLATAVQDSAVHGRTDPAYMGAIDTGPVRELVEEILEGGKTAFEMRRLKYGF
ncbi:MAG: TrlF family AAA-like ATPase [Terracidiphilus sp.]|jgi:DNA repair ATPase RecN